MVSFVVSGVVFYGDRALANHCVCKTDALEEYQALSAEGKAMIAEIRNLAEYFLEDPNVCEVR